MADLALASAGKQSGKGIKTKVGQICKKTLVPTFCFNYPLPPDWKEKATAVYAEFRVEYEQLLNSAGEPLKTASRQSAKKQRNQNAK
jgi:hypothetical protein